MFIKEHPNITELGGRVTDLRRLVDPEDKTWSATNPSIAMAPKNRYAIAVRSSNYVILPNGTYHVTTGGLIQSQVWFSELDKEFKIKNLKKVDLSNVGVELKRGLEDPKLFWRDGTWHFTAVMLEKSHTPYARMVTCELDSRGSKVVSLEKHSGMEEKKPEKNWMLTSERSPNFDFVYGPNAIIKDNIMTTKMEDSPKLSALRGNSNLLDLRDDTYLAVMHQTFHKSDMINSANSFGMIKATLRNYISYFVRFDSYGFPIGITKGFYFSRPGVEFAAGLTQNKKDFIVSFGREDVSSHLAFIDKQIILDGLQGV
jgi:hypothetical protein